MAKDLAIKYLLSDLKAAHMFLDQTMDGVTDEVAAFMPQNKANPIAGTYAHLLNSEDFFVQGFLKKSKPLYETSFKDKTGMSEVQPTEWETEYPKWLKEVKVDMGKIKEYQKAVFSASEEYLAGLTDEDLEKEVDMSMFGMGMRPTGDVITGFIIGHCWSLMGEISVLKGIQNLKGYPF